MMDHVQVINGRHSVREQQAVKREVKGKALVWSFEMQSAALTPLVLF